MSYPVKLKLYKNGHLFSELVAENDDDLNCPIEMDTGTGLLDALGLYDKLMKTGRSQATDTFRVCNSYEKWGAMQQEVVEIEVRMQRLDVPGNSRGTALGLVLGVLGGTCCGTAISITTLAVGIGAIGIVMFFMAFLSTLPAFFYVIFIIAGLAALALVVVTYLAMYAFAGVYTMDAFTSVSRIRQKTFPSGLRVLGTISAVLSVPTFFFIVQSIISQWGIGGFSEQLIMLFGQGFSAVERSSWGWMVWLNLTAGIGIVVASAWNHTGAANEETADEA